MKLSFTFPGLLLLSAAVQAQDTAPTVELAGVPVISQSHKDKDQELVPFNTFRKGTSIAFMVRPSAGGLLGLDQDKSKIDSFTDDTKKDLTDPDAFRGGFDAFFRISEDGKAGLFDVTGLAPEAKVTSVSVKGSIVLKTATKKGTNKNEKVALKKGDTLKVGTYEFSISDVESSGGSVSLGLETKQSVDKISEIRFLTADGTAIKADERGKSSMSFGGATTYNLSYELETSQATAVVEVEEWLDMKETTVPFSTTVSVGEKK